MKTRISTSCIISAGCQELVATGKDDYIRIAHETGLSFKRNPNKKIQLHEKVKYSELLDGDSLAKAMLTFAINREFQITYRIEKTSSSNTRIWMNKPL